MLKNARLQLSRSQQISCELSTWAYDPALTHGKDFQAVTLCHSL